MFKRVSLLFLGTIATVASYAQPQVADKVIAVVGDKIILQSEFNINLMQALKGAEAATDNADSMQCEVYRDMVGKLVLASEALRDSTLTARISDEVVDGELQRKIDYYAQTQFRGSIEQMEAYLGKTVYQMKEESRQSVKDDLLAKAMQEKLMENIKVTPAEVQAFFNSVPDSEKPMLAATVEVGQVILNPDVSTELDQYTRNKLADIRKQIVDDGKDFSLMAGLYSQDPGSKDEGGQITIDRKNFDPAFVSAAYKLQPGEISPVIKSQFGYHIIQMVKRMGEQAVVKHILIIPDITSADIQKAMTKLDTVYQELQNKKLTFSEAVSKYSNDKNAKMTGGMVYDPSTSASILQLDNLPDPGMAMTLSKMKVGEYSKPETFRDPYTGQQSTRILYLRSRTDPHQINLTDDYSSVQQAAARKKQNDYLMKWMREKIPTHYLKLDPAYADCPSLTEWYLLSTKK